VRIAYHADTDEIIDVNMRALKRLRVVKKWKRNSAVVLAATTGAFAFVFTPGDLSSRIGISLFFMAFVTGVFLFIYPITLYRRTRDLVTDRYGKTGGSDVEIELRESGIWTRTGGTQIEFSWANVAEIVDDRSVIEMPMKDGGLLVARKRAFQNEEEIAQFISLAKDKMNRVEAAG
jgi:hypothetical protein